MKRFHFRLEQVLRVRALQEDMARAALMTANRAAHDTATHVNVRLDEYSRRGMPSGVQTNEGFERALFLLDTAAGKVDVARAAHREALAVVDDRRAEWTHARRRVEALERLEERRREEHELENRRAEDRLVDDIVIGSHARVIGSHARVVASHARRLTGGHR